jgi:hypothetical protein
MPLCLRVLAGLNVNALASHTSSGWDASVASRVQASLVGKCCCQAGRRLVDVADVALLAGCVTGRAGGVLRWWMVIVVARATRALCLCVYLRVQVRSGFSLTLMPRAHSATLCVSAVDCAAVPRFARRLICWRYVKLVAIPRLPCGVCLLCWPCTVRTDTRCACPAGAAPPDRSHGCSGMSNSAACASSALLLTCLLFCLQVSGAASRGAVSLLAGRSM